VVAEKPYGPNISVTTPEYMVYGSKSEETCEIKGMYKSADAKHL
jgi:hypothetical protein